MSKLSLYENNWINLVFENRNREYGAYQLRQENSRTTYYALFLGILLCASLASIPRILSLISPETSIPSDIPTITDEIIEVTKIFPDQVKPAEPIAPKPVESKPATVEITKQLTNPIIVKAPLATPDIPTNIEMTVKQTSTSEAGATTGTGTAQGTGTTIAEPTDYGNTLVNSAVLDKLPEFPGGMAKFYTYIGKNFESPEINSDKNIRIFVAFVVEKDGSMTDIQVKNDPGYGLGKEAIRVLKSLRTKWIPGMIGSKPVRTAYNLPITVKIN